MDLNQISCDLKFPGRHHWIIAQNLESHKQLFYTVDTPPQYHHECRINVLDGRRIRACFHNWLILSNHPDSVLWSLWNQLTSTLIRLPPLIHQKQENHSHECCLSAPPDEEGSVLLLTKAKVPTIVFCRLDCKRKRLKWTEMSYAKQLRSITGVEPVDDYLLESPTCCSGKVYALSYLTVIQIDIVLKGKEVVISLLPLVEIPHMSYNRCPPHNRLHTVCSFLKGSCPGPLFYIGVGYKDETSKSIVDVCLFTLDMTSMTWEEMLDLKDAVFLLQLATDYSACYYASAVDSGGYVHILGDSAKMICSFHAKDRTVTVSSIPCMVLESQASTWAMLEWRLESNHAEPKKQEEHKDTQIPVKGTDNIDINSTTGESHLLDIPFHMLEKIMELCVGVEYMKFRATCTRCSLAAPPIQWSNITALRRLQTYSLASPWLMVLDNYQDIMTFTDPICGDTYFIRKPQELKGDYHIYCSKYGWLLMYKCKDEPQLAFFNPFTSSIRKLPAVPYLESFCFSAPPTSPDCMVVGFTTSGHWHAFIHFVSRQPTWTIFRLNFGGDDPYHYHFPTFNGPDVYALCNNKGVDAFRGITTPDGYSWEVVVDGVPKSNCRSPTQYFLSSCDQHVLLVTVSELGESVEVFKLNESTKEWEKVNKLEKHMIYVSDTSCICIEAKSPEMGNKVYFPRLSHKDGTKIVFYSLDTCRYHTFEGKVIEESFGADLFATKRLCNPHTWIEPCWS